MAGRAPFWEFEAASAPSSELANFVLQTGLYVWFSDAVVGFHDAFVTIYKATMVFHNYLRFRRLVATRRFAMGLVDWQSSDMKWT